jgi:hypothetical protein
MKLYITRPDHDPVTACFFACSNEIITTANSKGCKVEKSEKEHANRKEVQSRLKANCPNLVVFNGHGSETEICGHDDEVIIDEHNADLLKDTITFARTCESLAKLGPITVTKGAKAFIGYKKYFRYITMNETETRPLSDPAAGPVLKASNIVPIKLLEGHTVEEAVNAAHHQTMKEALRLVQSEDIAEKNAFKYLILNDLALGYDGDGSANACHR